MAKHQVNVVVPPSCAGVIRDIAKRLREDEGFAEVLVGFLAAPSRPGAEARQSLDEARALMERLDRMEEEFRALQNERLGERVAILEAQGRRKLVSEEAATMTPPKAERNSRLMPVDQADKLRRIPADTAEELDRLLREGELNNSQIGERLDISAETVRKRRVRLKLPNPRQHPKNR